jgi:hypothetical protein
MLSRSLRQARIEPEASQLPDAKLSKAFVRRVDEEVGFGRDHGTGHLQDNRIALGKAFVPDRPRRLRRRVSLPIVWEGGLPDSCDEAFIYRDRNRRIVVEELFRVNMDQNLECGKRERLRRVHHGAPGESSSGLRSGGLDPQ